MTEQLPKQITDRLKAILRRVRRIQFFRGMLGVFTLGLAAVLVIMAADYFFAPLSTTIRWALFGGLVIVVLGSFWKLFLKPLNRKIELLQVARWLEIKHPKIQERISTALELSGTSGPGISENLLEELIKEAEVDVKDINPIVEVRTKKVRVWMWPAAALLATFVLLFAVWPDQARRLLVRAVAPFSETGNAGAVAFEILPGDLEVIEEDPVTIKVLYDGSSEDRITLETTKENGDVTTELLQFSGEEDGKQVATYRLATARESFRYRIMAGKSESDAYKVKVWPKPRFSQLEAIYDYPSYTGLARAKRELRSEGIQAIVGTQMRLDGTPNTPIESGVFMIDGKEIAPVKIEGSATGGRISIDFPMESNLAGVGTIVLKHRLGREIEAARFSIKALPDDAPVVNILTPVKRDLRVKPTDQIPITYQVLEEVGLQSSELVVMVKGQSGSTLTQVLPAKVKGRGAKKHLWKGETLVYIGALLENHPKAREIRLKFRVKDNRPEQLGGANIGESETIVLKISSSAQSIVRQELREQESEIREATEKAAKDIREAKQKMDANRENIKKEELPKHAEKQLEEAREKLADAEETLKDLAEKMENTVHAPKAEKAEKAAEKVKEAREKLENAPLQDTPEEKKEKLDEAREAADEALKEIEEMRREIEKDRQKVEDIAKLNELAQKERELARKAEKQAEEQVKPKPEVDENDKLAMREEKKQEQKQQQEEEEWKQAQREVQEELRREVAERPEAKAEVAKQQAEKARELAEEARDLAEKQEELKDLAEKAQDKQDDAQEELENEIKKQLEKAQEDVLKEAKEQLDQAREENEDRADKLPEAVDGAEKALEELQKDQPKEAAEAAKEAAEKLNDLAKPKAPKAAEAKDGAEAEGEEQANEGDQAEQGDKADPELQELAEKQEKVAEALEELSKGNTDKALEKLQELQADAAEKFEDAVEDIPEVDGKSNERNQAEQAARQADDHAGEAAKQAEEGNQEAAADRNEKAAEALEKSAKALDAEAENLEAKAAQAEAQAAEQQAQKAQENQAPADNKELADAFQKAAEAAQADTPAEAAQASKEAAEALSELAQQAMQNMQRGQKPGEKGMPDPLAKGEKGEPQPGEPKPGEKPEDGPREATPDPGVPPELAKLGVSLKDWQKLKEMMRSDVSGGGASDIPEDYRNLVKKYFEEVSSEGKPRK